MKYRISAALKVISDIGGDTAVSWEVTLEALEELQEDIESRITALKEEHE